jgi:1-acyl-sn-glycerol-3-phosphate acyltransferase
MVLLFFVLLFPFFYYLSRKQSRYPQFNKVRKLWAFLSSAFSGVFYKYEFESDLDWNKTYIICPNHASNLDISAISLMMNNNFFFLGKDELLSNPVMALFFSTIDIPVNRDSKIASYKAFKKTSERLENGMSLVIFPEGLIGNEYPPILHEFKSGPFKLAINHKIDILPVSIINNWKLLWDDGKKSGFNAGVSKIYIHKPIDCSTLTHLDEEQIKDLVYQKIASKIDYKL